MHCGRLATSATIQLLEATENMDLLERITHDPEVMGGRPCIRGLRVTVGTVLGLLASNHSHDEILKAYSYLEKEDIQAALSYAAWRTKEVDPSS